MSPSRGSNACSELLGDGVQQMASTASTGSDPAYGSGARQFHTLPVQIDDVQEESMNLARREDNPSGFAFKSGYRGRPELPVLSGSNGADNFFEWENWDSGAQDEIRGQDSAERLEYDQDMSAPGTYRVATLGRNKIPSHGETELNCTVEEGNASI